jgi:hypothetical protein
MSKISLHTGLSTGGVAGLRGLNIFIQDVRNSKSKEAELERVEKELANIRSKFKNKGLSSYEKKKYASARPSRAFLGETHRGDVAISRVARPVLLSRGPTEEKRKIKRRPPASSIVRATDPPSPVVPGTCGSSCTSSCSGTRSTSGTCKSSAS